jgi:hypothetical protein
VVAPDRPGAWGSLALSGWPPDKSVRVTGRNVVELDCPVV